MSFIPLLTWVTIVLDIMSLFLLVLTLVPTPIPKDPDGRDDELVDDDMSIVDLVDGDSEHEEEANCGEKRKPSLK